MNSVRILIFMDIRLHFLLLRCSRSIDKLINLSLVILITLRFNITHFDINCLFSFGTRKNIYISIYSVFFYGNFIIRKFSSVNNL